MNTGERKFRTRQITLVVEVESVSICRDRNGNVQKRKTILHGTIQTRRGVISFRVRVRVSSRVCDLRMKIRPDPPNIYYDPLSLLGAHVLNC